MKRNFINQTGDSNKFWTIEQTDNAFTVTWGKIGTQGRTSTKSFDGEGACQEEIEKLIREKLSKGYREIADLAQVPNKPVEEYRPMDEEVFWEIINLFNWDKLGDDDAVLRPAVKRLASMQIEDIHRFDDILSEKLFMLDGRRYAENIGEESYKGDSEFFSVDSFLYVRCCVVANGKRLFERVLADPTRMPKDADFEPLLYLASDAFNKKTKSDGYDHTTKFDFETYSNVEGWRNEEDKKPWWKFW